jgi:predicted chitinase
MIHYFIIICLLLNKYVVELQSTTTITTTTTTTLSTTTTNLLKSCNNLYGSSIKLTGDCSLIYNCKGAAFVTTDCPNPQICCVQDTSSSSSTNSKITKAIFLKIAGNTARNDWIYNYFSESMKSAEIDNEYKAAAYLSQLIGETDYFKSIEAIRPEKDNDPSIGNNKTGDGSLYRGRGGILLRGRLNYELASNGLNLNNNLIQYPELAVFPSNAFKIAAWFWKSNAFVVKSNSISKKESLNNLVDGTFFNFTMLTHSLTNNLQSLKQRAELNDLILKELNYNALKRGQGIQCTDESDGGKSNETGFAVPICLSDFKKSYCGCEGKYLMSSCPYGITSDRKCRNPAIVKCCFEKCKVSLDLVILSDSSGSIGQSNYTIIREFLTSLAKSLPIGYNETRVSIINFSTDADKVLNLLEGTDTQRVLNAIRDMPYKQGYTYTNLALKLANEKILNESLGMRPLKEGVPKVVMVITDGESTEPDQTLIEANKIKDRGFNIISVGIGNTNINELNGIATSLSDVYYVSDFNKVLQIISSLSRTACQQPAEIPSKIEIVSKVEKDSYKYFRLPLTNSNETFNQTLNEFTFELKILSGQTQLFYSFEDENPKSESDYLSNDNNPDQTDSNFIDSSNSYRNKRSLKSNKIQKASDNNFEKILYPVKRPVNGQNDIVYFSVKGLSDENNFQVYIYEEYIEKSSNLGLILGIVFSVLILLALSVVLGYFGMRHYRSREQNSEIDKKHNKTGRVQELVNWYDNLSKKSEKQEQKSNSNYRL